MDLLLSKRRLMKTLFILLNVILSGEGVQEFYVSVIYH